MAVPRKHSNSDAVERQPDYQNFIPVINEIADRYWDGSALSSLDPGHRRLPAWLARLCIWAHVKQADRQRAAALSRTE